MKSQLEYLCDLLKQCGVGCVIPTASYIKYCMVDQDDAPGVFISPLGARNDSKVACQAQITQDFLIAPFVKCESNESHQLFCKNGEIHGGAELAWRNFLKIKECLYCANEGTAKCNNTFILKNIGSIDVCNSHVSLPTIWETKYNC